MADRDPPDFGDFRPTRDRAPSGPRDNTRRPPELAPPQQPAPKRSEPRLDQRPVSDAELSPQSKRPRQPSDWEAPEAPATHAPPRAAAAVPEASDALPRIARTGPTTGRPPTTRQPEPARRAPPAQRAAPVEVFDEEETEGRPWFKILAVSVAGVVAIVGAAAVALMVYAPVDLVRDRLMAEVKAKTGRDLAIGGRPSVSFWPRVAISLGDVSLSNPPGMSGPPLLTMQRLDAAIQFWPLLSRQVVVDQLLLIAPVIDLRVDAQGRRNWDFAELLPTNRWQFAQAGPLDLDALPDELKDFAKGSTTAKRAPVTGDAFSLGRVRIVDGTLRHADLRGGDAHEARAINLSIEAPDLSGPLQAAGTVNWRDEVVRVDTRMTPLRALISQQPVQVSTVLNAAPLQLTYTGTYAGGGAPRLEGQLSAKAASIAKASTWLGQPMVGEPALGALNFKGKIALGQTRISVSDSQIQMTGLSASGGLALETAGVRPKLTGTIKAGDLNLDALGTLRLADAPVRPTLRPTLSGPTSPGPTSIEDLLKGGSPSKPEVRGFLERAGWSEERFNVAPLGLIDADLKVAFARLVSGTAQTGAGQVSVQLANSAARLTIDDLSLYDGRAKGTVSFDAAVAKPALAINVTFDGVSMQPLLAAANAEGLEGRARVVIAVSGLGQTERQIVDSLTGKAEVTLPKGAVTGYDLSAIVRGLGQGRMPRGEREPGARTEFTDFGASFTIARGVADNRDFRVVTREARAIGSGQIALGPRTLDFTLRPKLLAPVQTAPGLGGPGINLSNLEIPVRITGPLSKPVVTADIASVLKDPQKVIDAVKDLDPKQVEETVRGVLAGDGASKVKARDFLNNLLKK